MVSFSNRLLALSMYLIFLIPSVRLTYLAEKKLESNPQRDAKLVSVLAVLLPCILAAIRGSGVGVDVESYAIPVYQLTQRSTTIEHLLALNTRFEMGYLIIAFIASHVFKTFHAMLFITQLLIVTPIYIGVLKLRKKVPAWAAMLCFYTFFYIETFNIMRESIAVAFVFLAFVLMYEKKIFKSVVMVAIAYLFHSSSIIGFALMAFSLVFKAIKNRSLKFFLYVVLVIAIPLAMSQWTNILSFLASKSAVLAVYESKYRSKFLTGGTFITELYLGNYFELLARWVGLLTPLIYRLFVKKRDRDNFDFSILIGSSLGVFIYSVVFVFLHSSYGYRISSYVEILLILWVASLYSKGKGFKRVNLGTILMIACNVACFSVIYLWRGMHGTLPFAIQFYGF